MTYDNYVHQNDQNNQNVNRKAFSNRCTRHFRTAIHDDDRSAHDVVLDKCKVVMSLDKYRDVTSLDNKVDELAAVVLNTFNNVKNDKEMIMEFGTKCNRKTSDAHFLVINFDFLRLTRRAAICK